MTKHLLVVEHPNTRKELIQLAIERGYYITLLRGDTSLYRSSELESIHTRSSVNVVEGSTDNFAGFRDLVCKIHGLRQIDSIVALSEYSVEFASLVAAELQIRFTCPEGVKLARDKYALRLAVNPSSRTVVSDINGVSNAVRRIGYPCVVKPRRGAGSLNARVIFGVEDLAEYEKSFVNYPSNIREQISSDFVVEEYFSGRMYSIEIAQVGDSFRLLTLCERFRAAESETIELGTIMPPSSDLKLANAALSFASDIIRKSSLDLGIYHIEAIFDGSSFNLIEVNPRLMGGNLPELYNSTHKIGIYSHVLDVYCEQRLPESIRSSLIGMSCMIAPAEDGVLPFDLHLDWEVEFAKLKLSVKFFNQPGESVKVTKGNFDYIGRFLIFAEEVGSLTRARDAILVKLGHTLGFRLCAPESKRELRK